ncbi:MULTISPECIES: XkdX family protein [Lactiplantibacillus]|uniref:XkdX family protein n=1 Tax=Lactiplantibacillus TaxID=2767842 RepID=UPI0021CB314D|nr:MULTISPECIES: XkdX family protein [Lactiplantibacillus]MDV0431347.1 XkdX family protein [Lactiplantibacillus sp. DA1]WDQ19940.1 XkdX family protein [Lactiplantibacillus plantarum]BEI53938.1 hypothetical protein AWA2045_20690 [Lactiplantibacillus plantarum]
MMSTYEECLVFKSWGENDPNYYKVFVGLGLTTAQYKEITGVDYVATSNLVQPEGDGTSEV